MLRRQLPVNSTVRISALLRAARVVATRNARPIEALRDELARRFAADALALTDSGTSALVLAMRLAAPGGTVALPAWSCIDLAAAAIRAGVRVRLYDVDPTTLGPDLDDLRRTLRRGVDAVVVAHLYGYPVSMPDVLAIAREAGTPVIEDAAQGAGAALLGRPLGGWGELAVLSFGRGKGLSGGGGGALLARGDSWTQQVAALGRAPGPLPRGARNFVVAGAQWALGRPWLYGIPSRLPWLRLGEMVYRPAGEPSALPAAAASLVLHALDRAATDASQRAGCAGALGEMIAAAVNVRGIRPVDGAAPGYLRLPVIDRDARVAEPVAGILRGYPGTLADQKVLRPLLAGNEEAGPGATLLGRSLYTLPTHSLVGERDLETIALWLGVRRAMAEGSAAVGALTERAT